LKFSGLNPRGDVTLARIKKIAIKKYKFKNNVNLLLI